MKIVPPATSPFADSKIEPVYRFNADYFEIFMIRHFLNPQLVAWASSAACTALCSPRQMGANFAMPR